MLIERLEIISFGKFSNKTIDFNKGLNVICGENESGKSTVISFIFAMLYGFGDNRGKGLSLREKYIPWGGDFCEGKMLVTLDNGKRVTLYRKSGNAKKYDAFRVYDTDTGEELSLSTEEITGVNSETFLKTLCIRQMETFVGGSNSEIVARLSNISQGGDESVSYDKAVKILENAKREIQPLRGNNGKLAKLNEEISGLEKRQQDFLRTKAELDSAKALLPSSKETAAKLKKEYDELSAIDFTTPIAHLSGRIQEKESQTQSKTSPLILVSAVSLLVFMALLLMKIKFSFVFLILALGIFLYSRFSRKPQEDTLSSLNEELRIKTEEKNRHEKRMLLIQEKLQSAQETVANLNTRIISLSAISDESCVKKLQALYTEKHTLEKELHILTKSVQALTSAHEKMQKNFTPQLNKKASEYFSLITGAKYTRIYCDEDFGIKIETDLPRESSYFSGGTIDQLYLSLRLALTDMIFGSTVVPVILDEPFLQYDEKRIANTVALFNNLEKERQILLFSNSRIPISETEILT